MSEVPAPTCSFISHPPKEPWTPTQAHVTERLQTEDVQVDKARRHISSVLYFIIIHECKTLRHSSLEGAAGPHLNVSNNIFHFGPRHLLTRNSGAKSGSLKKKKDSKSHFSEPLPINSELCAKPKVA